MSTVSLLAVSMTIGTPDSARIARATSIPLIPGSIRSSRTISGRVSRNAASARSPSATKEGMNPSLRSTMPSISASAGSSSTTSTRALMRSSIPSRTSDIVNRPVVGRCMLAVGGLLEEGFTPKTTIFEYARRAGEDRAPHVADVLVEYVGRQTPLNRKEPLGRVPPVRDEEQPRVQPPQPVRPVHEVVAAPQHLRAVVVGRVGQ